MSQLTLEDVKDLLGKAHIPGSAEELEALINWTDRLVNEKGEHYVRTYRRRLYNQWIDIMTFGLSRV